LAIVILCNNLSS